ncbi:sigma-70 family RNA polymerase sigma factor [Haloferula sp. BvORR071]|uniref:RNA polymerase sigma factor n=1 Tax=Haloferula sp. BvORR071 TaxID=1396141 RepID=UPI000697F65F|nr:sigma-70 family RNA polymerase sigma factor [Haloferula sp. BvORR071]
MQASIDSPAGLATDSELLARFAGSGEEAAFAELVRRHSPLVFAIARRRLGDSGFAEDAAQQAFIAMARRAQKLRSIPCLAAWLHRVTVYEATTIIRREARHRRRASQAAQPDSGMAAGPDLDEALASLPGRDREILLLHHFERLGYTEIARRMHITAAAAQRRGHRALARLAGLLRRRENEAACSMWLAAGLAPLSTEVPGRFTERVLAIKKPASFGVPGLPLLAGFAVVGAAALAVQVTRPPAPPHPAVVPPAAPSTAMLPRGEVRKPRYSVADEQLAEDFREFITRAKLDSKDAWEWAKARPAGPMESRWISEGPQYFLGQAAWHLADRDLRAAERLLEVVEGTTERTAIIGGIFYSRARDNFASAIAWVDSFPEEYERRGVFHSGVYFHSENGRDYDYPGALKLARSPEVREWLIRETFFKSRKWDEGLIESVAGELQGDDRRAALAHVAMMRLERNDPQAYQILDEIKFADSFSIFPAVGRELRDPRQFLDWIATQKDGAERHSLVMNLWRDWSFEDAPAAAAWALEANRKGGVAGITLTPQDPVTQRLMTPASP